MLVRHSSREYRSVQGLDRVPGVSWSLCATVSKGLEALSGCARRGKRTRSTGGIELNTLDCTLTNQLAQCLEIDVAHTAMKLIYGDGTINNVGIMLGGFGSLDSRRAEAIEVVDVRYRAE